jgi:LL-diaminopimelate aminotransferase
VVATPGNGFGREGEGYFRMTLTVEKARLEEALQRFSKLKVETARKLVLS